MYWTDALKQSSHVLIAGCSGSGKSNALHAFLYRCLYCKDISLFVFIDLKRVELAPYKDIEQTLWYADNVKDAKKALENSLGLIEARYNDMLQKGLRKSDRCPIYIIIDEYADLVLLDKSVNPLVQRISQIGRASNVHLILCTQRPTSSDGVLTGAVKCNLETRLALRTMTAQDSRNIIGVNGAEKLPRYGKGILQFNGYNEEITIPYVSDEEIAEATAYYRRDYEREAKRLSAQLSETKPCANEFSTPKKGGRGVNRIFKKLFK